MISNFAFYLTLAVFFSGMLTAIHHYVIAKHPQHHWGKWHSVFDYARSFFPILLVVWLLRSFIIQPYRVPSGSLEPTVKPGDFIAVSQFDYGLRFPVFNVKFLSIGEPKRGDIALFRWPVNPAIVFVKRVVGIPGDRIVYRNKVLTINGVPATQKFIRTAYDYGSALGEKRQVNEMQENLSGVQHKIFIQPVGGETRSFNIVVPPHAYFMMGDNRDNSDDSRSWGFVSERALIGRAFGIWFSWDPVHHSVRWSRIASSVH